MVGAFFRTPSHPRAAYAIRTQPLSARTLHSPHEQRRGLLRAAALCAVLAHVQPARAADEAVRVDCPELTTEQAAEIESRVRASLLTTPPPASVAISCQPDRAEVRAESGTDSVSVSGATSADSLRDDLLRTE